jgi:hypothetical protein
LAMIARPPGPVARGVCRTLLAKAAIRAGEPHKGRALDIRPPVATSDPDRECDPATAEPWSGRHHEAQPNLMAMTASGINNRRRCALHGRSAEAGLDNPIRCPPKVENGALRINDFRGGFGKVSMVSAEQAFGGRVTWTPGSPTPSSISSPPEPAGASAQTSRG